MTNIGIATQATQIAALSKANDNIFLNSVFTVYSSSIWGCSSSERFNAAVGDESTHLRAEIGVSLMGELWAVRISSIACPSQPWPSLSPAPHGAAYAPHSGSTAHRPYLATTRGQHPAPAHSCLAKSSGL